MLGGRPDGAPGLLDGITGAGADLGGEGGEVLVRIAQGGAERPELGLRLLQGGLGGQGALPEEGAESQHDQDDHHRRDDDHPTTTTTARRTARIGLGHASDSFHHDDVAPSPPVRRCLQASGHHGGGPVSDAAQLT